ncbi:MAG TPA: hypothetical protein VML94_03765 [Thermoplasmata archaeon]|nr:hypothetical protein [Thermoplasmata archaeon]
MVDVLTVAVPIAGAAAGALAAWALLERLYVPIPPNKALVLFGRRARPAVGEGRDANAVAREPRILIGGGTYLPPWNKATAYLSLAPIEVETTVRALHVLEGGSAEGWEVALQIQVKIPAEPKALRAAAENLLGLGDEEVRGYVRRTVEGTVPTVLARIRRADGEPDWERLGTDIQAAVAPELVPAGLIVRSIAVTELRRIAPTGRPERPAEARRRAGWPTPSTDTAPARDDADLRLGRVERGLRAIAADLARLLRDEPGRPVEEGRWLDLPSPGPSPPPVHDSIADGRTPAPVRPSLRASPDAEANSESIG